MTENLFLECDGVRTHNLKNIHLEIPLKKWIAVTGVSGSGKSSLVFDTIYAESQRRFLETLGTYERQFLQGLPQGEFDSIENLPASVALKQSNKTGDPRSVIATAADISDSMRTLFMAFMETACSQCGSPVQLHRPAQLIEQISKEENKSTSYLVTVPFVFPTEKKKQKKLAQDLLVEGYVRIFHEGELISIEEAVEKGDLNPCEIVLDRIHSTTKQDEMLNRVETVWSQIKFSSRFSSVYLRKEPLEKKAFQLFHVQPFCEKCQQKTSTIQSGDLDWQSALGACKSCHGLGNVPVLDENKIIPNPSLSLQEGALKPWTSDTFLWIQEELLRECKKRNIDIKEPYAKLSSKDKQFIWKGEGTKVSKRIKSFVPVEHFFEVLEEEKYKSTSRILLAKYRKYVTCPQCHGARLGEIGRNARCFGKTFHELFQCEISDTLSWLENLQKRKENEKTLAAIGEVYKEILNKVTLLVKLGLGSATLFRRCKTLSGGEYQRVLLTRVIGNGLTDALYVLDEPSVGLGKNEIPQLIACLKQLRDLGNTVLMVEHEPSLIMAADTVIELGPGGGKEGGELVPLVGSMPASLQSEPLATEKFIAEPGAIPALRIEKFSALNCQQLDFEVYLGKLNVITGPSGAGKSTLVTFGLQSALEKMEETNLSSNQNLDMDSYTGTWKSLHIPKEFFAENQLISVEQKALHRTITSVPATLLGLMDLLRKQFAQSRQAKEEGFTPSDFSFNGAGGCETCNGRGVVQDDLFFLGQVEKVCPDCEGTRYKKEVLNVTYLNKNIHQWMSSTLLECLTSLGREKGFGKPLSLACELGLGHLNLGMPTSSMSGGEAQRLRICAALSKSGRKLFCILDEPTRGLSEKDISQLLRALLRLTREGHTFVVVEHHEAFEQNADYLLQMGPGSGHHGGQIVKRVFKNSR